jgi:hypothetical protein
MSLYVLSFYDVPVAHLRRWDICDQFVAALDDLVDAGCRMRSDSSSQPADFRCIAQKLMMSIVLS